jgi:hypothetical protein
MRMWVMRAAALYIGLGTQMAGQATPPGGRSGHTMVCGCRTNGGWPRS